MFTIEAVLSKDDMAIVAAKGHGKDLNSATICANIFVLNQPYDFHF